MRVDAQLSRRSQQLIGAAAQHYAAARSRDDIGDQAHELFGQSGAEGGLIRGGQRAKEKLHGTGAQERLILRFAECRRILAIDQGVLADVHLVAGFEPMFRSTHAVDIGPGPAALIGDLIPPLAQPDDGVLPGYLVSGKPYVRRGRLADADLVGKGVAHAQQRPIDNDQFGFHIRKVV